MLWPSLMFSNSLYLCIGFSSAKATNLLKRPERFGHLCQCLQILHSEDRVFMESSSCVFMSLWKLDLIVRQNASNLMASEWNSLEPHASWVQQNAAFDRDQSGWLSRVELPRLCRSSWCHHMCHVIPHDASMPAYSCWEDLSLRNLSNKLKGLESKRQQRGWKYNFFGSENLEISKVWSIEIVFAYVRKWVFFRFVEP